MPPAWAFSIASAIRSSTRPPPTWNAGRLAPRSLSRASPKIAAPASTTKTVSVTALARRLREPASREAVTLRKIGTARKGSSTAVSVTMKRRYSGYAGHFFCVAARAALRIARLTRANAGRSPSIFEVGLETR